MSQNPLGASNAIEQFLVNPNIDLDSQGIGSSHFELGNPYNSAAVDALLQPPLHPHDGVMPGMRRAWPHHDFDQRPQQPHQATDLNILSAETHHDASPVDQERLHRFDPRNNMSTANLPAGGDEGQDSKPSTNEQSGHRKRVRTRLDDGGEDLSTKNRGRPRVDTRDATAADRRRTQIRLAQRAYRLRKETTISALKSKVSHLESTIDEINQSLLKLNDTAISSGITHSSPTFAQELKQTTDYLLSLARNATSPSDQEEEQGPDDHSRNRDSVSSEGSKIYEPLRRKQSHHSAALQTESQVPAVLGTQITNDNNDEIVHSDGRYRSDLPSQTVQQLRNASIRPTPPILQFGGHDTPPHYDEQIPLVANSGRAIPSPMQMTPTPIHTYSFQETSFARHLTRATMESAYRRILNTNTPVSVISRIFGYCLSYATREKIAERLKSILLRSSKESLENDFAPLSHVGGAGTHFPAVDGRARSLPSPSVIETTIGPQPVAKTSLGAWPDPSLESWLDSIGFGGEWFDPSDVESYLREQGVLLEHNTSFANVQLPVHGRPGSPPKITAGNICYDGSTTLPLGADQLAAYAGHEIYSYSQIPQCSAETFSIAPTTDPYGFADQGITATSIPEMLTPPYNPTPQTVTNVVGIDVSVLVNEMIKNAVCLGRTPGYRRENIDSALRVAMQAY